jgi:hypothetical protein
MQNTLQYYERNYDRVQDILSDIGGISRTVSTVAFLINLLVHNYIVVLDTQDLVLSAELKNYNGRDVNQRPTILRKANDIMFPPRRRPYQLQKHQNDSQLNQQSTNYRRLMKDPVDIYNNIDSRNENTDLNKNFNFKRNNRVKYNNYNISKEGGDMKNINYQDSNVGGYGRNISNEGKRNSKSMTEKNLKDENIAQKNEEFDIEKRPLEKQNFHWYKYLRYLICCKDDKKIRYYEDFRAKIISEENIIQSYLDIYKLKSH